MEENIIMDEVDVIELAPVENASKHSAKRFVRLGIGVAAVTAGFLLVKKVIAPAIKRRKARKAAEAESCDSDVIDSYVVED